MKIESDPQPVTLFKQVFARLTPETVMPLADLYAADIEFEDPFRRIVGRETLAAYFAKLNARVEFAEFAFGSQVVTSSEAALTWTMTVRTRRPRQTIQVPGVSVIRFGGLITHQRDYFDVGAMLYERLPILGWVLRRFKRLLG